MSIGNADRSFVDVDRYEFLALGVNEKRDGEGAQKHRDGVPAWVLDVLRKSLDGDRSDVMSVTVHAKEKPQADGLVTFDGLEMGHYKMDSRSGIYFTASGVEKVAGGAPSLAGLD